MSNLTRGNLFDSACDATSRGTSSPTFAGSAPWATLVPSLRSLVKGTHFDDAHATSPGGLRKAMASAALGMMLRRAFACCTLLALAGQLAASTAAASAAAHAPSPSPGASQASTEKHMSNDDSFMPEADRQAPPEVKPVLRDGVRYETLVGGAHDAQVGGLIAAFDAATGQRLWTLAVFDNKRDPAFEGDTQDVFVREMHFGADGRLQVVDELGRHWVVDVKTRTATPATPSR